MMRAAAAVLVASGCLCAQDWPGWRGPGRDGKAVGFQAPKEWPKELAKGWQVEVGEGLSTPALVDGKLYLHTRQGEDEAVLCLDAGTGKEIWKQKYPAPFTPATAAVQYGKGPFSSPTVSEGRVFAFGISGILSCLDAKTGGVVWRKDFKDDVPRPDPVWGTALSPLVAGGLCVVHVGREGKGKVLALNVADGKAKWEWEGDGPGYASPILATVGGKPQIITQSEFKAIGLSPADGTLLWSMDYKTAYEQNSITPVVLGDGVLLSGLGRGISAWKPVGDKPEPVWETSEASLYMSSPVLKGDRLFGFSEKRMGQFFCLDASSGKTLWTQGGRLGMNAALVDAGDVVLALLSHDPKAPKPSVLVVFEANDKQYVEKARYTVSDGIACAHPVVSGRSIFVKDATKLTQWTLP